MKIYIVQGTTGEYSDRSDWLVCAYRFKEAAEEHASKAMRRAMQLKTLEAYPYMHQTEKNEFDPDMKMDYTGTAYTVLKVELVWNGGATKTRGAA